MFRLALIALILAVSSNVASHLLQPTDTDARTTPPSSLTARR